MKPLLDGDVLRYELGFAAETAWRGMYKDKDPEELGPPPWDLVAKMFHERLDYIYEEVGATEEPTIFLTGSTNFRDEIATVKEYKANRKSNKPFHWHNLTAYMHGMMDVMMKEGLEADDLMAIESNRMDTDTIICSRDKDLRQVPGWFYSWELGNQPAFGPVNIDRDGWIKLIRKEKKPAKIEGTGLSFFYSQCLTGDAVDNIPGLPKCGAVKAFELLSGRVGAEAMEEAVCGAYKEVYGASWEEHLLEQGRLLWMVRELDDDDNPIMWELGVYE